MNSLDILTYVLHEVMRAQPSFTEDQARQLLPKLRQALGGQEYYVGKRDPDVAAAVYHDAVATTLSTQEIVSKHGVSRRTMYRLLKRGPAR